VKKKAWDFTSWEIPASRLRLQPVDTEAWGWVRGWPCLDNETVDEGPLGIRPAFGPTELRPPEVTDDSKRSLGWSASRCETNCRVRLRGRVIRSVYDFCRGV